MPQKYLRLSLLSQALGLALTLVLFAGVTAPSAQPVKRAKPAAWTAIDTQTEADFSGGDIYSLGTARLLDAEGNFWVSWDTTLSLTSHKLSLINSRREPIESVRLTDIGAHNDSTLFICGEQGVLLHTKDWGKNWGQRYFDNLDRLFFYGVEFDLSGVGILIGVTGDNDSRYQGIMYRSVDGGENWKAVESITGMGFSKVSWDRASGAFIVTAIGNFLISKDGGQTWKTVKAPNSTPMRDTRLLEQYGFSAGLNGSMLISSDTGSTWTELKSPTTTNLTAVYMHTPSVWYAAGASGEVWETFDRGKQWTSMHMPRDIVVSGMRRTAKRLVAWGSDGVVMKLGLKK